MKVKVNAQPQPIPQPTLLRAVVLKRLTSEVQVVVLLCPTPHGNYFLFVGDRGNSYLPEKEWDRFVGTAYTFVHAGNIDSMEVTFNA